MSTMLEEIVCQFGHKLGDMKTKTNLTIKDIVAPEGFVIVTQEKHGWMNS